MYQVKRFFQNSKFMTEIVKTGLTKEEAQEYCSDAEASSRTCETSINTLRTEKCGAWFCGYEEV